MFNSGFIPSVDGTEKVYDVNVQDIPDEFSYMKNLPGVLDQGADPICIPCSISAWIDYRISLKTGVLKHSKVKLFDIFNSRTTTGEGMTCKDAFKYIIEHGVKYKDGTYNASRYYAVRNLTSLRHAIVSNGPCLAVLPVYDTDVTKFWTKDSDFVGYHAVSVVGFDKYGFIIRNSWGSGYGTKGYAYISDEDMGKCKV